MRPADDAVDISGRIFFHGKPAEVIAGFFCFTDDQGSGFCADAGFSVQCHGDSCGGEVQSGGQFFCGDSHI